MCVEDYRRHRINYGAKQYATVENSAHLERETVCTVPKVCALFLTYCSRYKSLGEVTNHIMPNGPLTLTYTPQSNKKTHYVANYPVI